MKFDLTKSLGNPVTPKNPRPVQVSFQLYADREEVRGTAFSLKESLESKNLGVGGPASTKLARCSQTTLYTSDE